MLGSVTRTWVGRECARFIFWWFGGNCYLFFFMSLLNMHSGASYIRVGDFTTFVPTFEIWHLAFAILEVQCGKTTPTGVGGM